jgi:heptosyltransferase I
VDHTVDHVRARFRAARRILVIKPSALGDVVQTLPIVAPRREVAPPAAFDWVISAELRELVTGHPGIASAIPFHRGGGLLPYLRLLERLAAARYDIVLDLQGLLRTATMSVATGAALRLGLETAREGAAFAAHLTIPQTGPTIPAHARYARVADWITGSQPAPASQRPAAQRLVSQLPVTGKHLNRATSLLAGLPRPVLAIHPGAKWVTKRWPPEKFAAVASRYLAETAGSVVIVGAPSERDLAERLLAERSPAQSSRALNLSGQTTLLELAALLHQVDRVLSNDSGPMHLAAAMGTPVVGLFTCTSPLLSGPVPRTDLEIHVEGRPINPSTDHPPRPHQLVATHLPCAAGYHKLCPLTGPAHTACFTELDTDRVWKALAESLRK